MRSHASSQVRTVTLDKKDENLQRHNERRVGVGESAGRASPPAA
jgi:hypothetical protein